MNVWAVANQKGGVGKTTTTVTLAGLLAGRGHRTLVLDTDPHGSLTSYFRYSPDELETSVYTLFENKAVDPLTLIRPTRFDHLHIMPAAMALATLDRQSGAQGGMGLVLRRALSRLSERYDYALIDCPPMLGVLMVNALACCDRLIVPVQTEFLASKGLERMVRTLGMITRSRASPLPHLIVPTLFDRRTRASTDTLRLLRSRYGQDVWRWVIPVDTQFREASKAGIPLSYIAPTARGVMAYQRLLADLTDACAHTRQVVGL